MLATENENETLACDWIPAGEAAKLVPSPKGGTTFVGTIHRWVQTGKIRGRRRGRWLFVLREEIEQLARGEDVPRKAPEPGPAAQRRAQSEFNRRILEENGLDGKRRKRK